MKPPEVFTPRNPEVNEAMYVARPELEKALIRAVEGTQHVLIHGESGSGKSWLYKRILHQNNMAMIIANLANAARLGSIVAEIQSVVHDLATPTKTGYVETKAAEASAFGLAKGSLAHATSYAVPANGDPLESAFALLRQRAEDRPCCLILDNLETIFSSPERMAELGEIVVLLDDNRYARHKVKLIIVGVPRGAREYFSRVENRSTVANRIAELPEVAALDPKQVEHLVRTGFVNQLAYTCEERDMVEIVQQTNYITTGIPQRVHEFCLELAYLGEDAGDKIDAAMLERASRKWLESSLTSVYAAIEAVMNERNTVAGRRNQVLFALGRIDKDEFGYAEIEEMVRRDFPDSTNDRTLNISGLLSDLAGREDSLIKRSPKGDRYIFVDPKYRMCLRVMLRKEGKRVDKVDIRKV